jgi:hypothetical protein
MGSKQSYDSNRLEKDTVQDLYEMHEQVKNENQYILKSTIHAKLKKYIETKLYKDMRKLAESGGNKIEKSIYVNCKLNQPVSRETINTLISEYTLPKCIKFTCVDTEKINLPPMVVRISMEGTIIPSNSETCV